MNRDRLVAALRRRIGALRSTHRIGKFVSVGALGAVCDTLVLLALAEGLDVLPELATVAGIETAIVVMFLVNDNWTFSQEGLAGKRSFLRRLGRSHLVRLGGSLTQFLVFVVVYRVLFVPLLLGDIAVFVDVLAAVGVGSSGVRNLDLWLIVSKGTGILVAMTVNYIFESLFTWQVHSE